MQFAHDYPDRLLRMIVVDIAPKQYPRQHDDVLDALNACDFNVLKNRQEIKQVLASYIESELLQQFILKSMICKDNTCRSCINISAITQSYSFISDAPSTVDQDPLNISSLFVRGSDSDYVLDSDFELIRGCFKPVHFVTIPNASHWLHAEQPDFFLDVVKQFLLV